MTPKSQKANQHVIFDDKPLYWQAWDTEVYSLDTRELPSGESEILAVAAAVAVGPVGGSTPPSSPMADAATPPGRSLFPSTPPSRFAASNRVN